MVRPSALALLASLVAHASAQADPLAPASMPDLDPHREVAVAMTAAGLLGDASVQTLGLDVRGRVRVSMVELFAGTSIVRHTQSGDDDRTWAHLGNLRVGLATVVGRGAWQVRPSVWVWAPTMLSISCPQGSPCDQPTSSESIDATLGLRDPYAWRDGVAFGGALDLRWRVPEGFVQLEVGTALINADDGLTNPQPELDDVFAAVGAGTTFERFVGSLEYRVIFEPWRIAPSPEVQHAMVGTLACRWATTTIVRMRMGLGVVDYRVVEGAAGERGLGVSLGADLIWRR